MTWSSWGAALPASPPGLYLARARYRVVIVEQDHFGGQVTITHQVVNYPGVAQASGAELTETMRRQAQSFGAEFLLAQVTGLDLTGDVKTVRTTRGRCPASGSCGPPGPTPEKWALPGRRPSRAGGVAYCATCDGEFFTGKDVFVVGGGFAAAEEAVFLTKYARHVTILIRGADFSCAPSVAQAARDHERITVLPTPRWRGVEGGRRPPPAALPQHPDRPGHRVPPPAGETFGLFVFAGYEPATELLQGVADLDDQGYVLTDRGQRTSADGLYAAGDVCQKPLRQVVTAVGDGALAATELEKYAAAAQARTGLRPTPPEVLPLPRRRGLPLQTRGTPSFRRRCWPNSRRCSAG